MAFPRFLKIFVKLYFDYKNSTSSKLAKVLKIREKLSICIMEQPLQPEARAEKIEYDFESGVKEIMERIESLLTEQDAVTVSICGPRENDRNVGKTKLSGRIGQELMSRDIPFFCTADDNLLSLHKPGDIVWRQRGEPTNKKVLILGAVCGLTSNDEMKIQKFKAVHDAVLTEAAQTAGLPFTKIDLHILIYSSDRVPPESERQGYPDLVIRNDHTVVKK